MQGVYVTYDGEECNVNVLTLAQVRKAIRDGKNVYAEYGCGHYSIDKITAAGGGFACQFTGTDRTFHVYELNEGTVNIW